MFKLFYAPGTCALATHIALEEAGRQWIDVLAVARSPELHYILSNTAEAGYKLDATDRPDTAPPTSFPAKLLVLLKARHDAKLPGVTGSASPAILNRGLVSQSMTSRSGSRYGSGLRRTELTTVKIDVLAPMPSASTITEAAANAGVLFNARKL